MYKEYWSLALRVLIFLEHILNNCFSTIILRMIKYIENTTLQNHIREQGNEFEGSVIHKRR